LIGFEVAQDGGVRIIAPAADLLNLARWLEIAATEGRDTDATFVADRGLTSVRIIVATEEE
jgi:hypothetical protein